MHTVATSTEGNTSSTEKLTQKKKKRSQTHTTNHAKKTLSACLQPTQQHTLHPPRTVTLTPAVLMPTALVATQVYTPLSLPERGPSTGDPPLTPKTCPLGLHQAMVGGPGLLVAWHCMFWRMVDELIVRLAGMVVK